MLKSWWTAAAAVAVLAGSLLAIAPAPPSVVEDEAMVLVGGRGGDRRGEPLHFRLEGRTVHGLYPGAVRQMRVTVVNPLGYRLRLQQLSGWVVSSSRRGCPAKPTSLEVRRYSGHLPITLPPHSRTTLTGSLPVAMPMTTTEKCAGSRFTIALSGIGSRVDR